MWSVTDGQQGEISILIKSLSMFTIKKINQQKILLEKYNLVFKKYFFFILDCKHFIKIIIY
jgi:hypothetical protein